MLVYMYVLRFELLWLSTGLEAAAFMECRAFSIWKWHFWDEGLLLIPHNLVFAIHAVVYHWLSPLCLPFMQWHTTGSVPCVCHSCSGIPLAQSPVFAIHVVAYHWLGPLCLPFMQWCTIGSVPCVCHSCSGVPLAQSPVFAIHAVVYLCACIVGCFTSVYALLDISPMCVLCWMFHCKVKCRMRTKCSHMTKCQKVCEKSG